MINGMTDPRFAQVQAAFEENFSSHGEVGAGLTVYQHGQVVVDLWSGVARLARGALGPDGSP